MHYRRLLTLGFTCGLALSTGVASAQSVSTSALPGINFSAYRTYTWVSASPPSGMNPIMYQRIIGNFEAQMANKGYRKAEPADLSLVVTIGAQQKTATEYFGRFGHQVSIRKYTEGQLSLDAFDTKTQKALWHGHASKAINPDKPDPAGVDKAISKLMKKFPVGATTRPGGG